MKTFNYINRNFPLPKIEAIEDSSGRRYRLPSGNLVPSITTVLSYFKRKQLQEWRDRVGEQEANREIGRAHV